MLGKFDFLTRSHSGLFLKFERLLLFITDLDSFNECPICRDDFSVDDELSNLPCKHQFHPECVKQWLTVSGTCPVW